MIICFRNISKFTSYLEIDSKAKVLNRKKLFTTAYRKQAQNRGVAIPSRNISGAGLSFALDKILNVLNACHAEDPKQTDVVVCVSGARPQLRDVTQILRSFWLAGIQCSVVQANNPEECQDMAKDLGAIYYIVYTDDGILRVRSWINDRFEERLLNRDEIIAYIKKALKPDIPIEPILFQHPMNSNESTKHSRSNASLPTVDIIFNTAEKMTASSRKRHENVLTNHMSESLLLFNKREQVAVIVVDLQPMIVRAMIGAIEPRGRNLRDINSEITHLIERFPESKRYIKDVISEIYDLYSEKKRSPIVCLYCLKDSYYRFVL